ncbi:erythrocyte membrane protein 1, PfEMP1, putative [Plasmodium reichenowi]|uniref:Erythrocyte membrane protein 1, PfEMP1, putative n=1 Tax=Plasmodium reichenowi TaxID=5854 RepID=A0A2P9D5R4_PLARE|nr:erythrocyte membrane protein 1, PfEMP1, putative [Plasmodium reichenowi]
MAPLSAAGGRGAEDGIEHDKDAKNMFDRIGKEVHDQVKNGEEKNYIEELKGNLSFATFFGGETAYSDNPCQLVDNYLIKTIGTGTSSDPCGNGKDGKGTGEVVKRFSDTLGGQCTDSKMRDDGKGACAPYRRLSLCNKNLEYLNNYNSNTSKHYLLAKVCYAAKHEGDSLTHYREQYDIQYPSSVSGSQICTMLARSFADIGDIIRGRDLYRGNKKESTRRENLENNLKKIFGNIYEKLLEENQKNVKKNQELRKRYGSDGDNYYKLREDWWTANRGKVWKALTCDAPESARYFRQTCGGDNESLSHASQKCRCKNKNFTEETDQVPTYFDYVPQYLRWFEEWAEDFCRKKNKKLKDVKTNCRGTFEGSNRYCSRNGYDCEKTIRKIELLRMGKGCTDCLFACNPYVDWIQKQKLEFDKQKNKYENVINGTSGSSRNRKKREARGTTKYDGYESKFYEKLKEKNNYGTVEGFLELLNNEKACKDVKDSDGGKINFKEVKSGSASVPGGGDSGTNDESQGTFYRSEYCQPCPHCGVKRKDNDWIKKSKNDNCNIKLYEPKKDAKSTDIKILKSGDEEKEIKEKLDKFCDEKKRGNSDSSLYEDWKCYQFDQLTQEGQDGEEDPEYNQEVKGAGGLCILQNKINIEKKGKKQKTFNDFFNFWVAHMLKDSIHWRKEKIKSCINITNGNTCKKNNCNDKCKCYESWVEQKKKDEWEKLKDHYEKQPGFENIGAYMILEYNLKNDYFPKIKDSYKEVKSVQEIEQIIGKETVNTTKEDNSIDKLLDNELNEANKCKDCKDPPKPASDLGRSDNPDDNPPQRADDTGHDSDESSEEEEEEEDDDDEVGSSSEEDNLEGQDEDVEDTIPEPTTQETTVDVCQIVSQLFKDPGNTFTEACNLKYGKGKNYGWKCISDTTSKGGSNSESEAAKRIHKRSAKSSVTTTTSSGAICVPPRRRKMYIKKIVDWATNYTTGNTQEGESGVQSRSNGVTEGASSGPSTSEGSDQTAPESSAQTVSKSGDQTLSESEKLRNAFIESAAIETFFLWDRYKKIKDKEKQEELAREGGGLDGELLLPMPLAGSRGSIGPRGPNGPYPAALPRGPGPTLGQYGQEGEEAGQPNGYVGAHGYVQATSEHSWARGQPGFISGSTDDEQQTGVPPFNNLLLRNGGPSPLPQLVGLSGVPGSDSSDNSPEKQLKEGKIPNDFLKQMFYTLADYRDICVGVTDNDVNNALEKSVYKESSDKDKESETSSKESDMQKIKTAIDNHFNGDNNKATTVTLPPQHSDKTLSTSGKDPSSWWKDHAEHIWHGMICALTYEDSDGAKGGTPTQNDTLKGKLWNTTTNEPIEKYHYDSVTLEDESDETSPKSPNDSTSGGDPINNPKLKDFVEIPPFFRYLHEWGEEFCGMRTRLLEKIKEECMDDDKQKYSGDGEACERSDISKKGLFSDLDGPTCARHCRFYRRWIGRKRTEYDKQKNVFTKQKKDAQNNNNGFYKTIEKYNEAGDFLEKLKNGPCSKKDNDDNDIGGGKKIFQNTDETFKPATNCKPCSQFKVNCQNGKCSEPQVKCNQGTITANSINDSTEDIGMLVSDKSGKEFDDLEACQDKCIFKGFRKDVWKCGNVCDYVVCKPETVSENKKNNQIVLINAVLKRWLEYFLEDYNKIRKKLKSCKKTDKESTCIKECVEKWVEAKMKEWQNIKATYQKLNKNQNDDGTNTLKNFLEPLIPQIPVVDDKGKHDTLDKLKTSLKCHCPENSENEKDEKKDIVQCLLDNLGEKAQTCLSSASGEEKQCEQPPPEPDEEETEEENPENKVAQYPSFCTEIKPEPETVDDGECKPADKKVENKEDDEDKGEKNVDEQAEPAGAPSGDQGTTEQDNKDNPQSEKPPVPDPAAPKEDKKVEPKPLQPPSQPKTPQYTSSDWWNVMSASAFPWTVGVAFVALTYWLLKKKTKSSVDMLRVLQIPQNDYEIPTLKSSNRYIPYTSGKYRGKRYIYLEGDSGTDSGYTDHYSDITSSSESEYEEFDINDIYPHQSPKYKTLIEVVLEPSGKNTPTSGNTIPTSDIPPPTSDIPNTPSDIPNTPSDTTNTPSDIPPPITDEEWNELKHDFISNMLQNEPNDMPNDYTSGTIPTNTNNTTPSRDTLDQKPFIMSIHDRNLLSGEEYNYDMSTNSGENNLYSGSGLIGDNRGSYSDNHHPYSGIDLINDSLNSGNKHIDIYDELLKRKENELCGTNHVKQTSTHSVAKNTNSDPIHNQLNLFHKWLDRHRNMYEKWDKNKVEILDKLKEEWNKENNNDSSLTHTSNIPSGENSIKNVLNTDVSIHIHMDDPKHTNEFSNMDTYPNNSSMDNILDDLKKYNEPYYDIYEDDKPSVDDNI